MNTKLIIKIIIAILVVAIVVATTIVTVLVILPQQGITTNRAKLEVAKADTLESVGDGIHFLKTGSSDAILIESDGHFALVDCGEDSDNPRGFEELVYDGYEQEILQYLKDNATAKDGKVHLDFVLGTHSHSDHIGGFDTIIMDDGVVVDRAYLKEYDESKINSHEVECWDNKEVYQQMVDALTAKRVQIISDIEETEFELGNFHIQLFNTEYDSDATDIGENDNSMGVLVSKAGKKAFLAGDIDDKSGDETRLAPMIGKVDVLKVGHHSYSGSTTPGWLKTLQPSVCVVTNNFEQTDKRTLRRISRLCKAPLLITGSENGVIVVFNDDGTLSYYNDIY